MQSGKSITPHSQQSHWDFRVALGLVLILFFFAGCASIRNDTSLTRFEFQQPHMGTLFIITLYATNETSARVGSDAAFSKIAVLDRMMTDYDPESELMRLCREPAGKPVRLSDDLFDILRESLSIAELSHGAFDPTIGPIIRQWRRARRQETLPTTDQIKHAKKSVGWHNLKLDPVTRTATLLTNDMQLDLGGIAKGYAADKSLEVLRQNGITRALVAASGDIAAGESPPGQKGWRVFIGTPYSTNSISKKLLLSNAAVSTSGDSEQFVTIGGNRYSHIVDPFTGIGLTNQLQVSVIAPRATQTDALATTACVMGAERGIEFIKSFPQATAMVIYTKNGKQVMNTSQRLSNLHSVIEE